MHSSKLAYENAARMYGLNAVRAVWRGDTEMAAYMASKAATFAHAAMRCIASALR